MRILRKLAELSHLERGLLLEAFLVVAAVRTRLWVAPVSQVRRSLDRRSSPSPALTPARLSPDQIARAVERVSRYVPRASCLTQALATRYLLGRNGYRSTIRFGVTQAEGVGFRAHAWVEEGGRVLVGGAEMDQYQPLSASAVDQ